MRKFNVVSLVALIILVMLMGIVALTPSPDKIAKANPGTNWYGEYFNNATLTGAPVATRTDDHIDFNWGSNSPFPGTVPNDNFSVRWTKEKVNFPTDGKWTFKAGADDGIRVWIDVTLIIDEWHGSASGFTEYTGTLDALTAGEHDLKVEYYEASGDARVVVSWQPGDSGTGTTPGTTGGPANWNAEYFNNASLTGTPVVTRTDGDINFNWADGSPDAAVPADFFSARWKTTVNFGSAGHWRFRVGADDGVRMWIDATLIIDEWHAAPGGYTVYETDVYQLTAGNHNLTVEYYEETGLAGIQVRWEYAPGDGLGPTPAPLPTATPIPKTVWAAVTADNVNVRVGPGRGNPVIRQVFYPENYEVLGITKDYAWVKIVLDDGIEAWVSNEWVWLWSKDDDFMKNVALLDVPIAPPAALPEPGEFGRVILNGVATDTVNMRDGPSLYGAKKIGSLPQGAIVQVEAHNGNGAWYLISYSGIRAWVSALYIRLTDGNVRDLLVSTEVVPAPPPGSVFVPEDDEGQPAVTVRGQAISNLRLREGASLQAKQIGSVPSDTEFVIEARNWNGAWYLITFDGQPGWVNAAYVTLIEGRVPDLPIQ